MSADARFKHLRIRHCHPDPSIIPGLKFVPAVLAGEFLFLSGEGPRRGSQFQFLGKVERDVCLEDAQKAAHLTGLNLIFTAQQALDSLDRVCRVTEVFGMVNCADGFSRQSDVVNGLSECLLEVFGSEIGAHTRCAVGMAELPFNICFEARMTLHVLPSS